MSYPIQIRPTESTLNSSLPPSLTSIRYRLASHFSMPLCVDVKIYNFVVGVAVAAVSFLASFNSWEREYILVTSGATVAWTLPYVSLHDFLVLFVVVVVAVAECFTCRGGMSCTCSRYCLVHADNVLALSYLAYNNNNNSSKNNKNSFGPIFRLTDFTGMTTTTDLCWVLRCRWVSGEFIECCCLQPTWAMGISVCVFVEIHRLSYYEIACYRLMFKFDYSR